MAIRQSNPDFHIILESSIVFAGGCRNLLNHPLSAAIKALSKIKDVKVSWYLPEAVKLEREFQMTAAAEALLSDFRGIEKLLAADFKVSKDDIVRAVSQNIEKSIADHSLSVIELDTNKVDWPSVLRAAIFRHPPFQVGEKEKGFRDAVILETFCQIAETLEKYENSRTVFLANDDLLFDAAEKRAKELGKNISVVRRLTELSSAINAIPAHLSISQINEILVRAALLFYQANDGKTLYYHAKVADIIRSKFSAQLARIPEDISADTTIEFAGFEIGRPTFLEKNGDLLDFSTVVTFVYWIRMSSPVVVAGGSFGAGGAFGAGGSFGGLPSAGTAFTSASPFNGPAPLIGSPAFSVSGTGGGGNGTVVGAYSTGSPTVGSFSTANTGPKIISISNSSPGIGANTSHITISTGSGRVMRHDFEVHWRARLSADGQLSEPQFRTVDLLPADS